MNVPNASSIRAQRLLPGLILTATVLVAACGGASAAPSIAPAPAASPSPAGPTSFAAWTAHLGFGGQAGPNQVRRIARYISDHAGAESLFDLDDDIATVAALNQWLDAHPPTPCWAVYHRTVRAYLATVETGWRAARPLVEKGGFVPGDVISSASEAANAANDLPAPESCP